MFKGLPKKQQLQLLRRRGIVSISDRAIRAVSLAVVLVTLLLTVPRFMTEVERVYRGSLAWKLPKPSALVDSFMIVVLVTSVGVVILGALTAASQSRGAFGWNLLRRNRTKDRGRALVASYLAALLLIGGMAGASTVAVLGYFLGLLRATTTQQAFSGYGAALVSNLKLLVVAALVCAILAAILTRFFFLVKNRARSTRGAD
jgi:hypothetical protein